MDTDRADLEKMGFLHKLLKEPGIISCRYMIMNAPSAD